MLHAGLSSIQDLSQQVARLVTRNKKLSGKVARQRAKAEQQAPVCRWVKHRTNAAVSDWAAHRFATMGPGGRGTTRVRTLRTDPTAHIPVLAVLPTS